MDGIQMLVTALITVGETNGIFADGTHRQALSVTNPATTYRDTDTDTHDIHAATALAGGR